MTSGGMPCCIGYGQGNEVSPDVCTVEKAWRNGGIGYQTIVGAVVVDLGGRYTRISQRI